MLRKLRSASRLSFAEWLLFLQAWVWLLLFDIGLRTRPFPGLQAFAARLSARPAPSPEQTKGLILALKTAVDRARLQPPLPDDLPAPLPGIAKDAGAKRGSLPN